jgi:hypothetical protein
VDTALVRQQASMPIVKALVVPLVERFWLSHVWAIVPAAAATTTRSWKEGQSFREKAELLGGEVKERVRSCIKYCLVKV